MSDLKAELDGRSATLCADVPIARFQCGDFLVIYSLVSKQVELTLIPISAMERQAHPRLVLGTPEICILPDALLPVLARRGPISLIQMKLLEDDTNGGFAGGRTMRANLSTSNLQFVEQRCEGSKTGFEVRTAMRGARSFLCTHVLQYEAGYQGVRVYTEFENSGEVPLTLEMLSSFSFGGISPFDAEDSVNRLRLHRFRSSWSAEGRHEAIDFEDLHLERSWLNASVVNERFGQVGSMPVRGWFSFAAIEDKVAGVFWAAQLGCGSSWQMEVFRIDDKVSLSGGLADREFGHWMKTVFPGERFTTPTATLTVCTGDIDSTSQRLVRMQEQALKDLPTIESDLPIVFNEWCSSWGKPTPEFISQTAECLRQTPVEIFVVDDGWAENPMGVGQFNGDWNVDRRRFPDGLKPVADGLRAKGLIPGLWFEFEVCTEGTNAFEVKDHQLCRDGRTLKVGTRHFWDFSDPWTSEYLRQKVISRLKLDGFGYLKVDYNDTLGLGCDHPDSLGEGLRQHIAGVQEFFRELRRELPDLIIEVCSSGGHRLEPSFMALVAMGSFSDAHECPEIPIIAANLHRLILPRQNQIWAVLHSGDSLQRLQYSLAATFLGRVCLSGEISTLVHEQFDLLLLNLEFYRRVKHIIRSGESKLIRKLSKSWRKPEGYQLVVRTSQESPFPEALVVIHAFGKSVGASGQIELPAALGWSVIEKCARGISIEGQSDFGFRVHEDFSSAVIHLWARKML